MIVLSARIFKRQDNHQSTHGKLDKFSATLAVPVAADFHVSKKTNPALLLLIHPLASTNKILILYSVPIDYSIDTLPIRTLLLMLVS